MTEFENEVKFNQKFFQRIKYVYDHEYNTLKGEDKKLLEVVYKRLHSCWCLAPKGEDGTYAGNQQGVGKASAGVWRYAS